MKLEHWLGVFCRFVTHGSSHLPDGTRDMDQSVCSVEYRQSGLMVLHEPLLESMLRDREEEAQPAKLLKLQHGQAVVLCYFPYSSFGKNLLRNDLGQAVGKICYDPVKHLH